MQKDRPSIQEVALRLKDFIFLDTVDKFNVFDKTEFENFIDTAFENIAVDLTPDVTTVDFTNSDDMTRFVNELYSTFNKLFNEGRSVSNIINNFISEHSKNNEEVFTWLLIHNNNARNICLLGLFYSWNIGTDETNVNVFNLFTESAKKGDTIAQYFVAKCYELGWNTKKNRTKAIEGYTKAIEKGCTAAERMLGEYFYRLRSYTRAFKYLNKAADKGNILAMHTLGLCYQEGYGTYNDVVKAFKLFKESAEKGLSISQYELGYCYEYGKGTEKNLEKALNWYQKATKQDYTYHNHLTRIEAQINRKTVPRQTQPAA
ncbi:8061_t:CDS:1 [Scutellospora calospora]|uniref:8061_t:CDS:1 n=1 Tax=Scutellospora calospora TaxID=85575 RepID=A0ACA9LMU7_9GLOM|nr:8061_t:CDS:1 [Scutellospora calospora]